VLSVTPSLTAAPLVDLLSQEGSCYWEDRTIRDPDAPCLRQTGNSVFWHFRRVSVRRGAPVALLECHVKVVWPDP
jgi:hypothetical protein